MEVKVFNPQADQIMAGDIFIAEVTRVEGHTVVKLVRDADYFERQDNPEAFEQRDDSFDDMDGDEAYAQRHAEAEAESIEQEQEEFETLEAS